MCARMKFLSDELIRLRDTLLDYPGRHTVFLHLRAPANGETVIELPEQVRIAPSAELEDMVGKLFGPRVSFHALKLLKRLISTDITERASRFDRRRPAFARSKVPLDYSLEELERLAKTAGANRVRKYTQQVDSITPATLMGRGKVDEIQSSHCKICMPIW